MWANLKIWNAPADGRIALLAIASRNSPISTSFRSKRAVKNLILSSRSLSILCFFLKLFSDVFNINLFISDDFMNSCIFRLSMNLKIFACRWNDRPIWEFMDSKDETVRMFNFATESEFRPFYERIEYWLTLDFGQYFLISMLCYLMNPKWIEIYKKNIQIPLLSR